MAYDKVTRVCNATCVEAIAGWQLPDNQPFSFLDVQGLLGGISRG